MAALIAESKSELLDTDTPRSLVVPYINALYFSCAFNVEVLPAPSVPLIFPGSYTC